MCDSNFTENIGFLEPWNWILETRKHTKLVLMLILKCEISAQLQVKSMAEFLAYTRKKTVKSMRLNKGGRLQFIS